MRIHDRFLQGVAGHFRQTIILSSFSTTEMHAMLTMHCNNHFGLWRLTMKPKKLNKNLDKSRIKLFMKINPLSIVTAMDDRFNYFVREIWPKIIELSSIGQLIFVKS